MIVDDELSPDMRETLDALQNYVDRSLVIVPRRPSVAMIRAAQSICPLTPTQIRRIYDIMLWSVDIDSEIEQH
ncbi:MAG: hypothetical protein ILP11_00890 [Alphaproteobacteria bacterium]|nr:hypothetical protein [Alphaproteobacteria bacterium]